MAAIMAQKNDLHMTRGGKKYETCETGQRRDSEREEREPTSSSENNVPPTGAPNETATPAAHAALMISRRFASLRSYLGKNRLAMLPTQLAMCTKGPSCYRSTRQYRRRIDMMVYSPSQGTVQRQQTAPIRRSSWPKSNFPSIRE